MTDTAALKQKLLNKQFWFIVLVYVARLAYCYAGYLKNYCWLDNQDESHVYLLGLDYFTTGKFPLWGPDVVYTNSHLAGGLQGFLIGAPLSIWANPFAPYLFLFLMESVALIYLSWYVCKLFPNMKQWIIYSIVAFAPFAVHTGLKVINPAYVLILSVPFTLSVIECFELFEKRLIKPEWRFFWMSFSIICAFQIHPSYIILVLLWGAALFYIFRRKTTEFSGWLKISGLSVLGFIIGFLTIIPALEKYGLSVFVQQGKNIDFSFKHIGDIGAVLYFYITLAGYDMNTFSPAYTFNSLWKTLPKPFAIVFGILQVVGLLIAASQVIIYFIRGAKVYMTQYKRFLYASLILIVCLGIIYMFSFVRPGEHALIIFFPLSVIYVCICIQFFMQKNFLKEIYVVIFFSLAAVYYLTVSIATYRLPDLGYREKAFTALEDKDAAKFETPRIADNTNNNQPPPPTPPKADNTTNKVPVAVNTPAVANKVVKHKHHRKHKKHHRRRKHHTIIHKASSDSTQSTH